MMCSITRGRVALWFGRLTSAAVVMLVILIAVPAYARLEMRVERTEHGGMQVVQLRDVATGRALLADDKPPLFWVNLHDRETNAPRSISASAGWKDLQIEVVGPATRMVWSDPIDPAYRGISVRATATTQRDGAIAWKMHVRIDNPDLIIWNVIYPQIALRENGKLSTLLVPDGCGVEHRDIWRTPATYKGVYPTMHATMQFFALYDASRTGGFYLGLHDPTASMKRYDVQTQFDRKRVLMSITHEPPGKGTAVRQYDLPGEVVWAPLEGDWFDAAARYRTWVRAEAPWYPRLVRGQRSDTPQGMRDGYFWLSYGGDPTKAVETIMPVVDYMQVPVAVHFYNWHQIPFDNDYPHFLPPREGFDEAVKALNARGVLTMPYTNGRLWDTHDKGAEDWRFTSEALPATTKLLAGDPVVETYKSMESNGDPVRLAVMCPSTQLWQDTMVNLARDIVEQHGLTGVYFDQIGAAPPVLCMDRTHDHPVGGGAWWVKSYDKLLERAQREIGEDAVLTTESAAEPYLKRFDGLLSWDWQSNGQVPALPAVYGGAVQLFGRNYAYWKERDTADMALRQKAAQQFTFGEQLGWVYPSSVLSLKEGAPYFRHLARMRWNVRAYFAGGQMSRPPVIEARQPTQRADWFWSGTEQWVTTDTVLTSAWSIPAEGKTVLLMVNIGNQPLASRLRFDPADYGLAANRFDAFRVSVDDERERVQDVAGWLDAPIIFAPGRATVFELVAR